MNRINRIHLFCDGSDRFVDPIHHWKTGADDRAESKTRTQNECRGKCSLGQGDMPHNQPIDAS